MAKEKKQNKKKDKKEHSTGWMSELRYGRSVSLEFFKTNAWLMLIFVVAMISLMGLRYKTKTKMSEIKQLNKELQRVESEKLQEKARYMSLIRETEMRKMVSEKGLDLQYQDQPPYVLIDE
ncbi:MAG: hypothetical protein K2H76_08215 [Muribaculaceae bacterium]|nr:hypothetical protein [Muribaculaceae bacterium]